MNTTNSEFPDKYFGSAAADTSAQSADYYKARLPRYRMRYLIGFINSIPQNGRVLDLGCGKGKTIRLIQAFRPDIHIDACDLTDMRPFLPPGINFVKCEAGAAAEFFPANTYDAIFNEHVIEHIVYPNTMIDSCFTLLKSGGRVFIETPNWTRLFVPFSPLYFWNDYTHIHPYCITAFQRMFIEYGFAPEYVISVSSMDFGRRFLKVRLENGAIKTGFKADTPVFKAAETKIRKIWNAFLDLTLHPVMRDILIGVAKKP